MKHLIHYQITLSAPQLEYLAESKYHKNRMAFFLDLVRSAVLKPSRSLLPGCDKTIVTGQVEKSEVQLAKDWDCDRKTVSKVIATMNRLGIITTEKSNRTSVHTIHPVAAWIVDNVRIRNPHFKTGYDYRQIHDGAFEGIPNASGFIKEFMSANAESAIAQHSANGEDFPKGKTSNKDMVRLLPTVRNFVNYEQREKEASTTLYPANGCNNSSSDEKQTVASFFLPSCKYSHPNEKEKLNPKPSHSDNMIPAEKHTDLDVPVASQTPQLPFGRNDNG